MCPSLCETLPGKRQSQCFGSVHCQNFRQRYKTLQHRAGWKGKRKAPATLANTSPANPICDCDFGQRSKVLGAFERRSAIAISSHAGANLLAPWQVGTRRVARATLLALTPLGREDGGVSPCHSAQCFQTNSPAFWQSESLRAPQFIYKA